MKKIRYLIRKNIDWFIIFILALMPLISKLTIENLPFWNRGLGCFNLIINMFTLLAIFLLEGVGLDRLPFEGFVSFILNFFVLFGGYYLLKKLYFKLPKDSMYRRLLILIIMVALLIAIGMLLDFCLNFSIF